MKQPETFIISDTHFGHRRICEFEPVHRPFSSIEEHDRELVRRWNDAVRPDDIVYHLGDVCFNSTFWPLPLLNGRKRLVMGNHDHYQQPEFMNVWEKIFGVHEYRGCVLTHVPVHPAQLNRFKCNIHGHLHSDKLADPRYICVSVEHINLTPIRVSDIVNKDGSPKRR